MIIHLPPESLGEASVAACSSSFASSCAITLRCFFNGGLVAMAFLFSFTWLYRYHSSFLCLDRRSLDWRLLPLPKQTRLSSSLLRRCRASNVDSKVHYKGNVFLLLRAILTLGVGQSTKSSLVASEKKPGKTKKRMKL